jgi:hypothetical protein
VAFLGDVGLAHADARERCRARSAPQSLTGRARIASHRLEALRLLQEQAQLEYERAGIHRFERSAAL